MSSLRRIILFPFRPGEVARHLQQNPRWVLALLTLAFLSIVAAALSHPAQVERTLAALPPSADAADRMQMREYLRAGLATRLAFIPFRLVMGWSAMAFGFWTLVKTIPTPHPVRYTQLFALEVHAETVSVLAFLLRACLVSTGVLPDVGEESLPFNAMMLFAGVSDPLLRALLSSINLHTLWYIWIVGCGVSVLCGYAKSRAFVYSTAIWALALALNLAILRLLQGALHIAQ